MKTIVTSLLFFLIVNNAHCFSCLKEIKKSRKNIKIAKISQDKASEYLESHEVFLYKRNFTLAKKYINFSFKRIESAISKYNVAILTLKKAHPKCPKRKEKIENLLFDSINTLNNLKFQRSIIKEISLRF
jgi:cellobiose-specific phosphotransferase system component IIB